MEGALYDVNSDVNDVNILNAGLLFTQLSLFQDCWRFLTIFKNSTFPNHNDRVNSFGVFTLY